MTPAPPDLPSETLPVPPVWAPLANRDFRALYGSLFITMVGSWMNSVGCAWLMTTLNPSAVMLGLVQASFTLPGVLFSLPGGVLADKVDRRRYVMVTSIFLVLVSLDLGLLSAMSWVSPGVLLLHTFVIGSLFSLQGPALQSIIQDMVRRDLLMQALTLNSIALNFGRAVGPAIAGAIIAGVGIAFSFIVNACGYCVLGVVISRWHPIQRRQLVRESYGQAFMTALRFAATERRFRGILMRFSFYLLSAAMLLSLMPLVAKARLSGGAQAFGTLITLVGIGAVLAAVARGRTAHMLSPEGHARISALMTSLATLAMAFADTLWWASAAAVLYGAGWTNGSVTYQVAAQMSLPAAMRGRGVALFIMVFSFGIMFSGLIWGMVSDLTSIRSALIAVGALGIVIDLACSRIRISFPPIVEDDQEATSGPLEKKD